MRIEAGLDRRKGEQKVGIEPVPGGRSHDSSLDVLPIGWIGPKAPKPLKETIVNRVVLERGGFPVLRWTAFRTGSLR